MEAAIRFFSLQKTSAGNISISWIWFGGTSGHWKKQLDLSNYVPMKNLDKEQNDNFWEAPVDSAQLTIGKFLSHTIGQFYLICPGWLSPKTKCTSLEWVVSKWLSITNPPKHSIAITLFWTD